MNEYQDQVEWFEIVRPAPLPGVSPVHVVDWRDTREEAEEQANLFRRICPGIPFTVRRRTGLGS